MPVVCYQVAGFEEAGASVLSVNTYSRWPPETNIEALLGLVAPSLRPLGRTSTSSVFSFFDLDFRFEVASSDLQNAIALLSAHMAPTVTAITSCSLSVCLDFYQHPDEETGRWSKTEIGSLVYAAKYGGRLKEAGPLLARKVTDYVAEHPMMRTAAGVAGVPSSQSLGQAERGLVGGVARWVSQELGMPIVQLARVRKTAHAQKNLPAGDDPDGNQAGTMQAHAVPDGVVLVLDDLMRHASTLNEAARALSAAGAGSVVSLTFAKERTGTRGFQFP